VALVDDEDYDRVMQYKWCFGKIGYAMRNISKYARRDGKHGMQYLHRFIMGEPPGMEVDHRDEDRLNCQKYNLRVATHAQNTQHRGPLKTNTSGRKGVTRNHRAGKWVAQIDVNGVHKNLGYFDDIQSAHAAYCMAAEELHGEFAKTS
jgi:hypothetical protein